MSSVQEAIDSLRAALEKKGVQHHDRESFNHFASCLVLLNSSSPSEQMIRKLCSVLRKPFLPLYRACLQPTLQLSSSILSTVLGNVCDNVEDDKLRAAWDETANVILSGVLDFLDEKDSGNIESDCVVWGVLYRIICDFFFLDSGRALPVFSIQLCLSAYNTLIETAARQASIGNALRDKAVFGGERLGAAMSRTRDYLLLEALLMLFARLLPPIHKTSQGKARRAKFVKEVLGSSKLFKCSEELLDIMSKTSGTQWDDVAAQIVDALARSDITYPQPFSIDEIAVCGRVFAQPLGTDRLVMDKQAFLVNIIAENDDPCESLQIPYSSIRTITLDTSGQDVPIGKVSVMVYLASPPSVADLEMKSLGGSQLHANFYCRMALWADSWRPYDVEECFLNPPMKVKRQCKSISIGSGFKFANDSSPVPPAASLEDKVQHVNQVYKTDVEESAASKAGSTPCIGDAVASPPPGPKHALRNEKLIPEIRQLAVVEDVSAATKVNLISSINSASEPVHQPVSPFPGDDSIKAMQPFGDESELSEISDFEPENDTVGGRIVNVVSASRESGFKTIGRGIVRMGMNGHSVTTSAMGLEETSNSTSKTSGRTDGVARQPLETGKSLLVSNSPIFSSSSTTQINGSPKQPPNAETLTAGIESAGNLSVISQVFASTNVDDRSPVDTKFIVTSEGKSFTSAADGGEHSRPFTSSSANYQKIHPSIEIASLASTPPKIAGIRRKREITKPSSKAVSVIELDDVFTPSRKKPRGNKTREDIVKSNETPQDADSISGMKKHTKTASSRSTARQETRRSSRIKKRQPAATGRARAGTMCGNIQKLKKADGQAALMGSGTAPPQDKGVKLSPTTPPNPSLQPIPISNKESSSAKIDSHVTLVELRTSEEITPEASITQEILESISTREPTQLSITPTKESRGNFESNQQTVSDTMQFVQPHLDIKIEENVEDRQIRSDFHATDDIGRDNEVTAYPLSSGESKGTSESPRSSDRDEGKIHKASVSTPASPGADLQAMFIGKSDQFEHVSIEEFPLIPSSRHSRRSVTFASPIEYVLEQKFKSKKTDSSSSHRFPLSPESNSLTLSSGTVNRRHESSNRVMPQITLENTKLLQGQKASIRARVPDEVGIQDIVEVLNEIQAVITKGISDKFRNVRKEVQQGREELIRQVLDELRYMVVESEKYLNALVRLEEDYYKSGKAITRCWEELIDYNDVAATRSQNAVKEYDQNTSARTFPKSLLALKPVFRGRHANA
ncbi:hypothetical protein JVU11DRAFT_517 [Chiua virens]|nr:hypothetical protein JVU11DRAFT_517 [Chiua virens]